MELFDPGNIFFWRAIERLIALIIGAASIYLGYRLFTSMEQFKADGEGKVELPGGVSIYVSRVGPGVFFALFGASIVGFGILSPAQIQTNAPAENSTVTAQEVDASYAGNTASNPVFDAERARTLRDLDALSQLQNKLSEADNHRTDWSEVDRNRLRIAIPHIRQMLMIAVWDDQNWGDLAKFRDWVQNGDPASTPPGITATGQQYLIGEN